MEIYWAEANVRADARCEGLPDAVPFPKGMNINSHG